jgi:hypothetical protein
MFRTLSRQFGESIVGRRRLNSHSGRARDGTVPRLHREITPGERAVNGERHDGRHVHRKALFCMAPQPPGPATPWPQGPDGGAHWPTGSMLDPAAWVASGSLLGCQPDCRVRAGEAESEQSGHSRAHTPPASTLPPPPTISFAAETLAVWSISTEHGA